MKDKISIIIPIYNADKYLENCLDSILCQTYTNFELILINDGSQDMSFQICKRYEKIDGRIKLYNQNNSGASSARNKGLSLAKGEYVIFIDSDDLLDKDMLEFLINNAKSEKADISICGYRVRTLDNKEIKYYDSQQSKTLNREQTIIEFFLNDGFGIGLWNKLFKRKVLQDIVFSTDIIINEDKRFIFDAILNSEQNIFVDKCKYNYIKRDNSITASKFSQKNFDPLKGNEYIRKKLEDIKFLDKENIIKANEIITLIRLNRSLTFSKDKKKYKKELKKIRKEIKKVNIKPIKQYLQMFDFIELLILKYFEYCYYIIFYCLIRIKILKKAKSFIKRK